ncbi:MAG: HlyD family efflux transporter periplasmic adaptor subunit [Bacteroidales bacterium]|nr:HlyD family efflux transporter periplasmic adaptor subunit [Bacteroidales bacterium]
MIHARRENITSQIKVQQEQLKNLEREKNRLDKLVSGNAATQQQLEDIEGKIDVTVSQINSTKTQFQGLEAELSMLNAQLALLNNQLEKCMVYNPVEGTVLEKYILAHELVTPGKSLYKIADLSSLELKVYISGNQLSRIAIGDSAQVYFDENEDNLKSMPGIIYWISSEVEFTPKIIQTRDERVNMVYAVKIRVANDGSVKIGMPGEVKF